MSVYCHYRSYLTRTLEQFARLKILALSLYSAKLTVTTKLSDRNYDRSANTLFLILQPNLTHDSGGER
jgi:hypothetical protein